MFCSQCGTDNAPGIHFCGNCGARMVETAAPPQQPPVQMPVQPQAPPQPQAPGYASTGQAATSPPGYSAATGQAGYGQPRRSPVSIDFRRLGTGDWIALVGTVLLLISIFLSWYSATGEDDAGDVITLKENIFGQFAGGFRILILITCIFIILYLFIRTMTPRGLRLPLPHWQVLAVLAALQLILTVLAFFLKPGAGSGVPVSWQYGAYIGLPAAVIAAVGAAMRSREPEVVVPGAPRQGFGGGYGTPGYGQPSYGAPTYGAPQQAQTIQCAQCGTALAAGAPYCTNCGTPTAG